MPILLLSALAFIHASLCLANPAADELFAKMRNETLTVEAFNNLKDEIDPNEIRTRDLVDELRALGVVVPDDLRNYRRESLLFFACHWRNPNPDLISALLDAGADPLLPVGNTFNGEVETLGHILQRGDLPFETVRRIAEMLMHRGARLGRYALYYSPSERPELHEWFNRRSLEQLAQLTNFEHGPVL